MFAAPPWSNRPTGDLALYSLRCDRERFARFFRGLLQAGVYFAPSQFEAGFISTAHTEADIELTVQTAAQVLREV